MAGIVLAGLASNAQPANAQSAIGPRVDRLESEMRAVQRKVFPGGGGQVFEPQITPGRSPPDSAGLPSGSPVLDLTARVNALEAQLGVLTGQTETTRHKLQQIEDAFNAYKRSSDARLKALEDTASSTTSGATAPAVPAAAPKPKSKPAAAKPADPAAASVAPKTPARAALVAAVERPETGDAGEDGYSYGYRLWQAKLYPEAAAQFKSVVATYPKHRRASYAQNMLGRTYLDEGKPSLASIAFYDNYKKMPDGERAPDSLYYLGQALVKLNKPADACKVYAELNDVYGAKIGAGMKAKIAQGRREAKCS